ncbi:hypothetical protein [Streptomyces sp. SS]|uniref:hypothetical protein n=1 Tax=Streptomyces sp. SS TaxID=260742 RepID=UPI00037CDD0C|nr:hypothetical protein [Streptomyces sp. SS]
MTGSSRRRKPGAAEAPGVTALMLLFFGWEAASGGTPGWLRIVFALLTLLMAVELARFAVWRRRTRALR